MNDPINTQSSEKRVFFLRIVKDSNIISDGSENYTYKTTTTFRVLNEQEAPSHYDIFRQCGELMLIEHKTKHFYENPENYKKYRFGNQVEKFHTDGCSDL